MVDFNNTIATAQRLITANGRSITLVQLGSIPDNAAEPWKGNSDPRGAPDSTLVLDGVFVNPSSVTSLGLSAETSDFIKRSDQICIVSPGSTVDVRIFHEIEDGTESWKIEGIEILRPGAEIVLAYIGVRR